MKLNFKLKKISLYNTSCNFIAYVRLTNVVIKEIFKFAIIERVEMNPFKLNVGKLIGTSI